MVFTGERGVAMLSSPAHSNRNKMKKKWRRRLYGLLADDSASGRLNSSPGKSDGME